MPNTTGVQEVQEVQEAPEVERNEIQCFNCGLNRLNSEIVIDENNHNICQNCIGNGDFCYCRNCDYLVCSEDSFEDWLNNLICSSCRDEYYVCDNCDLLVHCDEAIHENDDSTFCPRCNRNNNRNSEVDIENKDYQNESFGNYIKSKRKFGIEIECLIPSINFSVIKEKLPKGFALKNDGSINSKSGYIPIEIVSPPLAGEKGEKIIIELCNLLSQNNVIVNKSCGYHLHLEAKELVSKNEKEKEDNVIRYIPNSRSENPYRIEKVKVPYSTGIEFYKLRRLFTTYHIFDDVLRAMQPLSRRQNTFCLPVSSLYSLQKIMNTNDYSDIEKLYYDEIDYQNVDTRKKGSKYDSSRYCGINLHNFFQKKTTIEIRYHCGTINAEKILNWIAINQSIIDKNIENETYSYNDSLTYEMLKTKDNLLKIEKKTKAMAQIFNWEKSLLDYVLKRIKSLT